MKKSLLAAALLLATLAAGGCDAITNRDRGSAPTDVAGPPPAAAPGGTVGGGSTGGTAPIRVDFEAHAYDPSRIEYPATFTATVSVIGVNGKEGKYESPPGSGNFVPGPRVEPGVITTQYRTYAEFGPDILSVSFSAAAVIPSGGTLECRAFVNGLPVAQERQRVPAATPPVAVPIVVACVYP